MYEYNIFDLGVSSGGEYWINGANTREGVKELAWSLARCKTGVLVVQDSSGKIIYEVLNDGLEMVSIDYPEIMVIV